MAKGSDIIKIGFDYRASLEQFEKETNGVFDGISTKAGKQRISIQLDAKNDKVIEKIKELQKLKLDKFTFEFGESGLAEQLKTFDQLEKKIGEIINLSKGINGKNIGNGIGNSIVDKESLDNIINLFEKMESHLGEIKKVFVDVGDGEEFSPLLSTIDKINTSISELSTSVKGIGLNMNIDVGSDSEAEAKVQSKISNALQAYQRLFDHIKMSGAGGSIVNTSFFEFDINQYDTMMAKLQAYKKFIDNMRKEAKTEYNGKDVLYQNTDKSYWSSASAAMGQVTRAFNEMNAASDTSPLENLFGKTDLSEVISQLELVVGKLDEISTTASSFIDLFSNGLNVNSSIEEIEKLTNRVKELEDELSNIKINPFVDGNKSNISSDKPTIKDVFQNEKVEQATTSAKELDKTLEQVNIPTDSFDDVLSKLDLAKSELKDIVKITKQSISDSEGKFHDSYALKDSRGSTEIYGLSSNTEKGQLLRSNIVQYDVKDEEQEAKEIQKIWDDNLKAITDYMDAKTELNNLEASDKKSNKKSNEIADLTQKVEETKAKAEEARIALSSMVNPNNVDIDTWNKWLKMMEDFRQAGDGSSKSIAKLKDAIANVNTSELQTIDKYIESAQKKLNSTKSSRDDGEKSSSFKTYEKDVQDCIDALIAERNRLENAVKSGDIEIIDKESLSNVDNLKKKLEDTNSEFKTMFKGSAEVSRWKEIDTITKYMEKNTRISKEAKDKLREYIETLKTNGADANVEEIHKAFLRVCDGERKAKREGQSFLDVLRDKVWYQWAAQIGSYFSFNDIIRYAKEGIQTVRELDTALVEMRKVSDESASSLKRVQDASFDLANEVGTTALQIQNSIADFMRIGDSVEEAQKHALDANTLLQVSEFDNIEDATSALVSMSKAWDDIDTKHINDVLNILGNNMPIATDELASSLQRSAGTLATLGATIEEAAALTVAGNSILQDPDSVAAGEFLPEYIVICRYFNIPESSYIG